MFLQGPKICSWCFFSFMGAGDLWPTLGSQGLLDFLVLQQERRGH